MGLKRKKQRSIASNVLSKADEIATRRLEEEVHDELSRLGMIWSGILDLESPILPSDVAAMMSSYELLRATRLVDSKLHWTTAASFAAIGAHCEPSEAALDPLIDRHDDDEEVFDAEKDEGSPIGFAPGHVVSRRP